MKNTLKLNSVLFLETSKIPKWLRDESILLSEILQTVKSQDLLHGLKNNPHLAVCERRTGRVEGGVQQWPGEVVEGQVAVDVGVQVEGGLGGGSLAVCEELVSNSGRRCDVEPTRGQARGRAQGGRTRVLVAHVAFTGMLDLFYLGTATKKKHQKSDSVGSSLLREIFNKNVFSRVQL